jgi:hypothetical protein
MLGDTYTAKVVVMLQMREDLPISGGDAWVALLL